MRSPCFFPLLLIPPETQLQLLGVTSVSSSKVWSHLEPTRGKLLKEMWRKFISGLQHPMINAAQWRGKHIYSACRHSLINLMNPLSAAWNLGCNLTCGGGGGRGTRRDAFNGEHTSAFSISVHVPPKGSGLRLGARPPVRAVAGVWGWTVGAGGCELLGLALTFLLTFPSLSTGRRKEEPGCFCGSQQAQSCACFQNLFSRGVEILGFDQLSWHLHSSSNTGEGPWHHR